MKPRIFRTRVGEYCFKPVYGGWTLVYSSRIKQKIQFHEFPSLDDALEYLKKLYLDFADVTR